jgi:hypothetical protein
MPGQRTRITAQPREYNSLQRLTGFLYRVELQ